MSNSNIDEPKVNSNEINDKQESRKQSNIYPEGNTTQDNNKVEPNKEEQNSPPVVINKENPSSIKLSPPKDLEVTAEQNIK